MHMQQPLGELPETPLHPSPTQACILLPGIHQRCTTLLPGPGAGVRGAGKYVGTLACTGHLAISVAVTLTQPWEVGVIPILRMAGWGSESPRRYSDARQKTKGSRGDQACLPQAHTPATTPQLPASTPQEYSAFPLLSSALLIGASW